MDFKHFKKVKASDTHTTFQHPEGHEITIQHSKISPKLRSEMERIPMAKGGRVPDAQPVPAPPSIDPDKARDFSRGFMSSTMAPKPKAYADGGPVEGRDQEVIQSIEKAEPPQSTIMDNILDRVAHPNFEKLFTPIPGHVTSEMPSFMDAKEKGEETVNPQGQFASDTAPPPAPPENMPIPGGAQPAPAMGDMLGTNEYLKSYGQGIGESRRGIEGQAQAEAQLGHEQEQLLAGGTHKLEDLAQHHQLQLEALNQERAHFIHDYEQQHIDPNHYWASKSTGAKIVTSIGLLLGGLMGGHVQEFMDREIGRDIEAQKAELGKSENLLSANLKQYGNLKDATDMTRVMQMDIVGNQLKQAAARSQDPMARSRAQQALGQLDMQSAPILAQMAMRRGLMQVQSSKGGASPEVMLRLLPAMGATGHDVGEAQKELEKVRQIEGLRKSMTTSFDDINGKFMNGLFSPNDVQSAKGSFIGAVQKMSEGRYNHEAAQLLSDSLFPGKTDSSATVEKKRARMNEFLDTFAQTPVLDSFGIRPPKAPSTPRNSKVPPSYNKGKR